MSASVVPGRSTWTEWLWLGFPMHESVNVRLNFANKIGVAVLRRQRPLCRHFCLAYCLPRRVALVYKCTLNFSFRKHDMIHFSLNVKGFSQQ